MTMLSNLISDIAFFLRAKNAHGLHSPFVYQLYDEVIALHHRYHYYDFDLIETARHVLLDSSEEIEVQDFGAGSHKHSGGQRKISDLARHSAISFKVGALLFRMILHFKPRFMIELGTSLGIGTLYQAMPLKGKTAKLYSFEGCAQTIHYAQKNLDYFDCKQAQIITGNIDETLPQFLAHHKPTLDWVFFDANHRYEPTMRYFENCLKYAHEGSVFIFDDIRWSSQMRKAWNEIKADERVMISIDLFRLGLVFFRKGQPKQHFDLRF
ncbi:MAG: class I SAM-dependent methyltransferase [Bernardetiaceae bacterium]|nr:class I SAM-dependent methyltransferase [Bernardetiaceae bacterium]